MTESAQVRREPLTYERGAPQSFFRDVGLASSQSQYAGEARPVWPATKRR